MNSKPEEINGVPSQQYHLTNLLLADAMARRYGNDRVAALQRCARKVRDETHDPHLEAVARKILKTAVGRWTQLLRMINELLIKMQQDNQEE